MEGISLASDWETDKLSQVTVNNLSQNPHHYLHRCLFNYHHYCVHLHGKSGSLSLPAVRVRAIKDLKSGSASFSLACECVTY